MSSLRLLIFALAAAAAAPAWCQSLPDLAVAPGDVRIEMRGDGGYHLFIRRKPAVSCVLLTETTKDPSGKAANYAYRASDWNAVNGDEKRMLDGKLLDPAMKLFSLISSTPAADAAFGSAFHIYIPYLVQWGYPWSRHGEDRLGDGSFINIRTFSKPYGDYSGPFRDNPYLIRVSQRERPDPSLLVPRPPEAGRKTVLAAPEAPPEMPAAEPAKPKEGLYLKDTVEAFEDIAEKGSGDAEYAENPADIVPKVRRILSEAVGKRVDLVVCLDTTESMHDDIDAVKRDLVPMVRDSIAGFPSFRLGMVLYKDYYEEYMAKRIEFTQDFAAFQRHLEAVVVRGGGDMPEAVYEALYMAETEFSWAAEKRIVILVGDAPPHPLPRGKITRDMVMKAAAERGVELNVIIIPQPK